MTLIDEVGSTRSIAISERRLRGGERNEGKYSKRKTEREKESTPQREMRPREQKRQDDEGIHRRAISATSNHRK